jgi:hypothetical protein
MSSLEELVPNLLANPSVDEGHRHAISNSAHTDSRGRKALEELEANLPLGYKVYVHHTRPIRIEDLSIPIDHPHADKRRRLGIGWEAYVYLPDTPVVLGNVRFDFRRQKGVSDRDYCPKDVQYNQWDWIIKSNKISKERGNANERTTANLKRAMSTIKEFCTPRPLYWYADNTLRWTRVVEESMDHQNDALNKEFDRAVYDLHEHVSDELHYEICKALLNGKQIWDVLEGTARDRYTKAMERVVRAHDEKADLHKEGNTEVYFVYVTREPHERVHTIGFTYEPKRKHLGLNPYAGLDIEESDHVIYDNPEDIPDFISNGCYALDMTDVCENQSSWGSSEQWVDRLGVRMAPDIYFVCRP